MYILYYGRNVWKIKENLS